MKAVVWFEEVGKEDVGLVGGKGANLGEMTRLGLPIPPGFIVTADAYFYFLEKAGIKEKIFKILEELDVDDTVRLNEAAQKIQALILSRPIPTDVATQIIEAYRKLGAPFVAVRSSATAEDLPQASFAGQQKTFLFVKGEDVLLKKVQECWASLFTPRAIFYREKQGFPHEKVGIAVVVQKMVNSEASGVMFTVDPITGRDVIVIEAAWGLGEAVVSGAVTPDRYVVSKDGVILDKKIARQEKMIVRAEFGGTRWVSVPEELREAQKLPDEKILELAELGKKIESHYGHPQDIEWALEEGTLYIVQARPVTAIGRIEKAEEVEEERVLVKGIPASPGTATGKVKIVLDIEDLAKVEKGDILVTTMTTPDMVPAMQRAAAIVTDEGGLTCHAAIVSRELGIPCVVGTGNATKVLKDGMVVTVDANKGVVYKGERKKIVKEEVIVVRRKKSEGGRIVTATLVKVNVALPEAADRAAATGADGVGLLRAEHLITAAGIHPAEFIRRKEEEKLVEAVKKGIKIVADRFYPKPVWYRTFDARTDEFRNLEGGDKEPIEANPMLGWHGIRRSLDQPELIMAEFRAIKELVEEGYTNLGVMLPFVQHVKELILAKELAEEVGLIPHEDVEFGIMVETPAAALTIEDFLEEGIDFLSFGTNDLTQLTLGIDRNNELVQKWWDEKHPAVLRMIKEVIDAAKEYGVETSICGQAGSDPKMAEILVWFGIDSISANIDAVETIREVVARTERKIMLERARYLEWMNSWEE